MMRLTLLVFLTLFNMELVVQGQSAKVLELRKAYKAALKDAKEAEDFYRKLADQKGSDPVEMAYRAASQALMAKNSKVLNKKMSYLKASDKIFHTAIEANPGNIEIRFLRFAIGTNLPSFIQNDQSIEDDKETLIENLPKAAEYGIGKEFKKEILEYVFNSGKCSKEEEKKLKAMMD